MWAHGTEKFICGTNTLWNMTLPFIQSLWIHEIHARTKIFTICFILHKSYWQWNVWTVFRAKQSKPKIIYHKHVIHYLFWWWCYPKRGIVFHSLGWLRVMPTMTSDLQCWWYEVLVFTSVWQILFTKPGECKFERETETETECSKGRRKNKCLKQTAYIFCDFF